MTKHRDFRHRWREAIGKGLEMFPYPKRRIRLGLGWIPNGNTRSLMLRLQEFETASSCSLRSRGDNSSNISERSFRFSEVQQSVSKCFRTCDGFNMFAATSSVLEILAKLGIDKLQMIQEILNGSAAQTLEAKFKALSACPATEKMPLQYG